MAATLGAAGFPAMSRPQILSGGRTISFTSRYRELTRRDTRTKSRFAMLRAMKTSPNPVLAGALVALLVPACGKSGDPGGAAAAKPAEDEPSEEAMAERAAALARLEKTELKLGFIKLTDCAPLVIAKELGYFEDEGLNVTLEAQANWKILLDRVLGGELDGAHMLAGQPLGATIGIGTQADVVTAFSMDLNGNGITVSNEIWKQMQEADPSLRAEHPAHPISAAALVPVVNRLKAKGTPLQLAMVFPVSTHNYELRYWLAAAGIHPGYYTPEDTRGVADGDVLISVTPPPQMPATMEAGTIQGYCVGEPWNQQAVMRGIGVAVATDYDVWKNNPEKVFGVTAEWAKVNPDTHVAVVKAMIRAGRWLDESTENRKKAAEILSRREYVGADYEVIANSMTGTFLSQKTDRRDLPDFNVFYRHHATYPFYSDAIWYLTQMRRWGQIAEPKSDAWYHETAKKVYRPEVYLEAARALLAEGKIEKDEVPWDSDGYRPPTAEFIDGVEYDGRKPLEYLSKLKIGHKDAQP
jgi:nitrate/nitrite transport system substrate-binding protein